MTSLRRPPRVFGVVLLDAIDDESIQALADPADTNHVTGSPVALIPFGMW